ncbi:hypothetical protein PENTCL1PPCAC_933, partial [Pristionchus entomophagus]
ERNDQDRESALSANEWYHTTETDQPMIVNVLVASCLIAIQLLSIFDQFGINGVIPLIQTHYSVNDAQTATIQTSSSIAHTATLVLLWLFGDTFKRRWLFLSSTAIWISFSLLSIVLGSGSFMIFVALRSLAAAASEVFGVLVPVMLADLFQERALGEALMCVSFGNTVTIMVAMVVSSWIVTSGLPWQSALIGVPLLTIVPLFCLIFANKTLGDAEQSAHQRSVRKTFSGAFGIFSIKSYMLLTAAAALAAFKHKANNFWFQSMYLIVWTNMPYLFYGLPFTVIQSINTIVTVIGMALAMPTLLWFAQSWRHGTGPFSGRKEFMRAYPIVVSVGFSVNAGLFVASLFLLDVNYIACLVVSFFIGLGNSTDTSLAQQMMLMVVSSNSRAAAVALSRLISAIVSIPSAQVVGMIADAIRGDSTLPYDQFRAYRLGIVSTSSASIVAAICYVILVFYFPGDSKRAEMEDTISERTPLIEKTRHEPIIDS